MYDLHYDISINIFKLSFLNTSGVLMAKDFSEKVIADFLAYLLLWITGVIVYFTKGRDNPRTKFHSIQAILLGLVSAIISIVSGLIGLLAITWVINFLIWLYGLYVGFKAYNGTDISIPFISEYSQAHSDYEIKTEKKGTKKERIKTKVDDPIKTLKLRYANGDITKREYLKMKKDLE